MYKTQNTIINIFTDASSCIAGSNYSACSAYILCVEEKESYRSATVYEGDYATNNFGELSAIKNAIELYETKIKKLTFNKTNDVVVRIISDSDYSLKCITTWSKKWISEYGVDGEWLNSSNKPVENIAVIKEILKLMRNSDVNYEFYHVNSHTYNTSKLSASKKKFIKKFPEFREDIDFLFKMNDEVDKLAGKWENIK